MSFQPLSRTGTRQFISWSGQSCRAYSVTATRLADVSVQAQSSTPTESGKAATSSPANVPKARKPGRPYRALRRKSAIQDNEALPFEQHPYQCFQEARKVLAADREKKLKQIEAQKAKIASNESRDAESFGGEQIKKSSLMGMRRHLQWLKIQADINDPVIKKRFEDGLADMNKPIYRYLAEEKWKSYDRKILVQRLTTMNVVPDLFAGLDPKIKVTLSFRGRNISPGDFVPSVISEVTPALQIQAYDKGPRYYTVAVIDPDVPDLETDSFSTRCHFLATNILIEPSQTSAPLPKLSKEQVLIDWLAPHAQKGSPYHRLCTFVFEHPGRMEPMARSDSEQSEEAIKGRMMDVAKMRERLPNGRDYSAGQIAAKFGLRPIGAHMFRTTWDDWMAAVMARNNIPGAEIELKKKRGEKLPPKKRDTARYR